MAKDAYHETIAAGGMHSGQANVVARLVRVQGRQGAGVRDAARGAGAHRPRDRASQRAQRGGSPGGGQAHQEAQLLKETAEHRRNGRIISALGTPRRLNLGQRAALVSNAEPRKTDEARRPTPRRRDGRSASPAPKLHGPKKRIGIVDFDDASHYGYYGGSRNALAEAARDAATEALVKSGAFVVVEREQLAQVLKEQGLGMTGAIIAADRGQGGQAPRPAGAVTGKITDFDRRREAGGFGGYYQSRDEDSTRA